MPGTFQKDQILTVLIIEDNPGDARLVQEMLKEVSRMDAEGPDFKFALAESIGDAKAQADAPSPDIIILDLGLPDSNGIETVHKIIDIFPGIPVITHTGTDDIQLGRQALRSGAANYLVKGENSASSLYKNLLYSFERHALQADLKRNKEQAELYLNTINVILVALDGEGNVNLVNPAGCELLGYRKEELVGYNWFDLCVPEGERARIKEVHRSNVERAESFVENYENEILTKDGVLRVIRWHNSLLENEAGEVVGTLSSGEDITEKRKADEKMRLANTVVENSPTVLFRWKAAPGWPVEYVSDNVRQFGYTPDELLSGEVSYSSIVHPDDLERIGNEAAQYAAKGRKRFDQEYRIIARDGTIHWLDDRSEVLRDEKGNVTHYQGIILDISDVRKSQETLKQYERIVGTSSDLMSFLDKDYVYQAVNEAYLKVWKKSRGEIVGHTPAEFMGKEKYETLLKPKLDACMEGNPVNYQEWFGYEDKKRYMDVHYYPYKNAKGSVEGIVVHVHDMTALKEMEESIQQKDELMIAQSKQAAMGEMISMIAHQWRQPITAIGMAINNLKADIELDSLEPERCSKAYGEIESLIQHLSKTIDDFREFFKPEKEKQCNTIEEVLEKTLSIVSKSLENNNIVLETHQESRNSLWLFPGEIIQVILNLIRNAKDVLQERKIENATIKIRTYDQGPCVVLEIEDNGGGIDDTIKNRVFDPYFTTKGPTSGTGLGLYMSKIIVEQHHQGEINILEGDNGVVFQIRLPISGNETSKENECKKSGN